MFVDMARFMRPVSRAPVPQSPTSSGIFGDGGGALDDRVAGGGTRMPGTPSGFDTHSGAPRRAEHPTTRIRRRLVEFLERQTGQGFGDDLDDWRDWYWNRPYEPHPAYAQFKRSSMAGSWTSAWLRSSPPTPSS